MPHLEGRPRPSSVNRSCWERALSEPIRCLSSATARESRLESVFRLPRRYRNRYISKGPSRSGWGLRSVHGSMPKI